MLLLDMHNVTTWTERLQLFVKLSKRHPTSITDALYLLIVYYYNQLLQICITTLQLPEICTHSEFPQDPHMQLIPVLKPLIGLHRLIYIAASQ